MTKGEKVANHYPTTSEWLKAVEKGMAPYLQKCGYTLPDDIDYTYCFTQNGLRERDAGQTIFPDAGKGRFRVILKWSCANLAVITGAQAHQWGHILADDPGHGPRVKQYWDRVGRDPDVKGLANAVPGWKMREAFDEVLKEMPPFPGVPVDFEALARRSLKGASGEGNGAIEGGEMRVGADIDPKQKTYSLKCECLAKDSEGKQCGYLARVTSIWIERHGAPLCPCEGHGPLFAHPRPEPARMETAATARPGTTPPVEG